MKKTVSFRYEFSAEELLSGISKCRELQGWPPLERGKIYFYNPVRGGLNGIGDVESMTVVISRDEESPD